MNTKYLKPIALLLLVFTFTTYGKAQINLPFEERGGLFLVKLTINKMEGQFVFDTGASNTVLDSALAVKLGLKSSGTNRSSSTGGVATFNYIDNYKIGISEKQEITCKKIIFSNLSALHGRIGVEFAGIIGFDILNKYITKIDYETKTISLYTQLNKSEIETYTPITFNLNNGIPIPQFNISFALNNGEKFNGPILFDSGAGLTLMVNTPFKESNQLDKKVGKTIALQGQDLFTKKQLEQARIKSITIGIYTFENLPITLTNTKAGVNSFTYYLGILGNQIISRFNVILDYSNKVIYLKPNKNFELPFDFPLSGIRFKKVKDKILIDYVVAGSEAEKIGLKPGQRVTSVDGYTGNDLEEFNKLIRQEGKAIKISTISDTKTTTVISLLLKKLI